MEGWTPRRQHRNGGFWLRAEIEMDRGSPIPRGPRFGFAAAVREPLVKLRRPQYDFEIWDWDYFVWPHDRLDANLEMRDSDPEATLEADLKASESFLNQRTLRLESYEISQHTQQQQQHAAAWPPCDHLVANLGLGVRGNSENEVKLGTGRKTKEPQLKKSEMDRRPKKQHEEEKENQETGLLRTPMPVIVNKKAVGPRSARRRRVFAEANRILDG